MPIEVKISSHTYLLEEAASAFRLPLSALQLKDTVSLQNRLFRRVDASEALLRSDGLEKLALQLSHPIQWSACLEACVETGTKVSLELWPGRALADIVAITYPYILARSLDDFHSLRGVRDWLIRVIEGD
ncbi:MAG: hypothetical protein WA777_15585 [Rhodanobacter sp.]